MSTVFVLKPCAVETTWLMSLSIKPGVSRVMTVMNKTTRLFHQARLGRAKDIITLFYWHQNMSQVEGYFDKEIARLTKLVKRKYKDHILFEPNSSTNYRIKVATPISACFYRLLSKFDTLMCLVETCITLGLFKKRRTLSKKNHVYSQKLLKIMNQIAHYKILSAHTEQNSLTEKEQTALAHALQSEVMPIFRKDVFDQLIALTTSNIIEEHE